MGKELPEGWKIFTLGEITSKPQYGWTSKSSETGNVKYLRTTDLSKGIVNWDTVPFCIDEPDKIEKYQLKENDILIARAGTIGVSFRIVNPPKNSVFASYLIRFKVINNDPKFIEYYLNSSEYWKAISEESSGIAVQNINAVKISNLKIPLPPLPDQQRIVAKLDSFFAHLEQVKQRMEQIPVLLKQFRQAVLTQAVTGKLTEEWRDGKELEKFTIDEIDIFRKVLKSNFSIEQGKKSFTYRKASIPKLGENTKGIDVLFVLDKNWNWVNLDMVTWNISDGPHFSPKYVSSEIGKRFISMRNITSKGIDFNDCKFVSKSDHLEFIKRGKPEKGDILYSKGGTTGIPCLVDSDTDFSYWVHVALLKPISKVIDSRYLKFTLESQLSYNQSQAFTHGVGNQDLGLTRMTNICFPLPPLQEQTEIVRRVEALFSKADAIEAQYKKLKEQIDQLPQAILAKAFRGEV